MIKNCLNTSNESFQGRRPHIDIYFVMSLDGVVAFGPDKDISDYSSREDREFFLNSLHNYDAIIVSSRTYVKNAPSGIKRIVLTHSTRHRLDNGSTPDIANTYMSGDVHKICKRMSDMGIRKAALVSGPMTCSSFLNARLIDELFITIEPLILGRGLRIFTDDAIISKWTLKEMRRLNENGTVMMHYSWNFSRRTV